MLSFVWISLILNLFVLALLRPLFESTQVAVIVTIASHMLLVVGWCFVNRKRWGFVLLIGYLLRVSAMLWDIYARNVFIFPGSGGDSEGFLRVALALSQDMSLFGADVYGGAYSKLLALLFYLTGPERILGHYLNVLFGLASIYYLYRICVMLELRRRVIRFCLVLAVVFPSAIINSAILLRESIISMLLVLSLYYAVRWYKHSGISNMLVCILMVLAASMFHAGVVGILAGYIFLFMFYRHGTQSLTFQPKTILVFSAFSVIMIALFLNYRTVFFDKFSSLDDFGYLVQMAGRSGIGGSGYLVRPNVDSLGAFLLNIPLRMFFFLSAPLPVYWRGLADIMAFVLDAVIYVGILGYAIWAFRKRSSNTAIMSALMIGVLVVLLIFGVGVANAGTAMRHRHKVFYVMVALLGLAIDSTYEFRRKRSRYTTFP